MLSAPPSEDNDVRAGGATLGANAILGDAGAVGSIAGRLRTAANNVHTIQSRISSNGLHGSWSGQAANAFESTLGQLPGELDKLGASFDAAAGALERFGSSLDTAQAKANWLAAKIEQAEGDMRGAQARHDSASRDLAHAERAHTNASDPASKVSAQQAVDQARAAAASAQAAVDDHNSEIASYRKQAESNREQYEEAVRACCGAVDAASALGIQNTVLGGVGHFMGEVGGVVAAPFVWVGGQIGDVGHAVVGWVDQNWETIRGVLDKLGQALAVVGVLAAVVAVFVQPELALPLFLYASRAQAVTDGAMGAGDAFVSATGDAKEKQKAEGHLVEDGMSIALDVSGLKAIKELPGGMKGEIALFRGRIDAVNHLESGIARDRVMYALEPQKWQWKSAITRFQNRLVPIQTAQYKEVTKAVHDYLQQEWGGKVTQTMWNSGGETSHRIGLPSAQPA
jgi:hypothetical protein